MMRRILRTLRARDDERGIALATVIGMGALLMILVATMATVSVAGARKETTDQNASSALAAAYAGLADYQSRLTADNAYGQYGTASAFAGASNFAGTKANNAFPTVSGGVSKARWVAVPGSTGEFYTYEVNNTNYAAQGVIKLRVTGRAGTTTKSLVADLKGDGFINYLYFTDYESSDPTITGETQSGSTTKLCTPQHLWERTYSSSTACDPVQFANGDVLTGPVRSNDEFTVCGAKFAKRVESGAADGVYNVPSGCRNTATFAAASSSVPQPAHVPTIDLPATNTNLVQETRSDLTSSTVPRPGCLYTGPTSITFTGNGSMTVVSPWTKATQIAIGSDGKMTGIAASQCGSIADLNSAGGATIKTLPSNLVYVQDVPTPSSSKDPNAWDTSSQPTTITANTMCNQTYNTSQRKWLPTSAYGNGLGYPQANEYVGNLGANGLYGCRSGDAFVKGGFSGAMTVGASNYLYVTGDITYQNAANDILGLVGQTAVSVWNPVSCSAYQTVRSAWGGTTTTNICDTGYGSSRLLARSSGASITINAAIASNQGTFQLQNYGYGAQLGNLNVLGSIAQEFRGAVGVSYSDHVTGVKKNYGYDNRLLSTAPPKFLQPVSTSYGPTTVVEVTPAFRGDGTCSSAATGSGCS